MPVDPKLNELVEHLNKAERPDTGEQGLRSVSYKDADDDSQAWIAEQRAIAVGHKISSVIDARRDGGTFRSFITVEDDCTCAVDGDCVSCERQIEELNRQMPAGWVAQFTGDANTDDGSTTLDIEITYAP